MKSIIKDKNLSARKTRHYSHGYFDSKVIPQFDALVNDPKTALSLSLFYFKQNKFNYIVAKSPYI